MPDPNLLLGFDTADDAAVWQVDKDNAAVLTLDFFTPVVDDPYEFGAVAAANALSDVFAMGGKPVTALNILAFPSCMGTEVVGDVLRGGADKVREAGAFVVGGHSIEDDEPKYGLSVFGLVHPERMVRNGGAQPGDALYYTKTLGTGIMNAALRAKLRTDEDLRPVIDGMMELNRAAAEAMLECDVHACTDVTGFGLAGHLHEMLEASGCAARLDWTACTSFRATTAAPARRSASLIGQARSWNKAASTTSSSTTAWACCATRKPPAACSWPSRPRMQAVSRRSASSVKGANPPESERLKPVRRARSS